MGGKRTPTSGVLPPEGGRPGPLIVALFGLSGLFFVAGIGWPFFKTISPAVITEAVREIATSYVSWFCILILGITASLFYGRGTSRQSARATFDGAPLQWFTGAAISHFAETELRQTARSDLEAFRIADRQHRALEHRLRRAEPKNRDEFMPPEWKEIKKEFDAVETEYYRLRRASAISSRRAMDDIYRQLRDGKLIARGFSQPVEANAKEMDIPAAQWRFLKFEDKLIEATGHDITYTAIAVAQV